MPNNNPNGVNSFDQFAAEPPYGEATQQANLAGGAPLAGAPIASGPISAPKRAQQAASRPAATATQAVPETIAPPAPSLAEAWAGIASLPGVTPLAADYAARAT